jgi:hypothetical protein
MDNKFKLITTSNFKIYLGQSTSHHNAIIVYTRWMLHAFRPANTRIGEHILEYAMPPIGGSGKLDEVSNLEFHNSNLILQYIHSC